MMDNCLRIRLLPLFICGLAACDDTSGPTPAGSVEITTVTTGGTVDADGYSVSIANTAAQSLGSNDVLTIDRVVPGTRSVELSGLAVNCQVSGENPRDVVVVDGSTVTTRFDVSCSQAIIGKILFQSNRAEVDRDIYTMNVDGSNVTKLTTTGADFTADVSPDGSRVAIASFRDRNMEVYVMNADGTGVTNLTRNPGADGSPDWSPDGSLILFDSDRDGNSDIYAMNGLGLDLVNLTSTPGVAEGDGRWSPDGTRIAFVVYDGLDADIADIYVMNADGSNRTQLTNEPGRHVSPTWSPDGSRIAFDSKRDGNREIYVMNADGTGEVNLTQNASTDEYPDWSPDGERLVFDSDRGGNRDVYVMNADGAGVINLTQHPGLDALPTWSP